METSATSTAEANPVFNGNFNHDPSQFDRFLEGNSDHPMEITLEIKQSSHSSAWLAIPLCLLLGAMGARRREGRNLK